MFQSSPGLAAGCYGASTASAQALSRFNPHPASRPGATRSGCQARSASQFQSSPGLAAGCYGNESQDQTPTIQFQSSPGLAAGCYLFEHGDLDRQGGVSILTRPRGRVLRCRGRFREQPSEVSILTRPRGRVLQSRDVSSESRRGRFNPHPASRPGATSSCARKRACGQRFQSSPGLAAGCYAEVHGV